MRVICSNGLVCDSNDYLSHHGILGQHWGKQNGPPYPLDASDHSASENKAGWRDSLDKGTIKRLRKTSKKVADESLNKRIEMRDYLLKKSRNIRTIDKNTYVMPKGSSLTRLAGEEDITSTRKYVSLSDSVDSKNYMQMIDYLPIKGSAYEYRYELNKDIKIASARQVSDYIIDKYGTTYVKDLPVNWSNFYNVSEKVAPLAVETLKKIGDIKLSSLYKTMDDVEQIMRSNTYLKNVTDEQSLALSMASHESLKSLMYKTMLKTPDNAEDVFNEFKKRGYDAIIDPEDKIGGYDYPMIILNPSEVMKVTSKKKILEKQDYKEPYRNNKIVSKVKALRSSGMSYEEIAKQLGISESNAWSIVNNA